MVPAPARMTLLDTHRARAQRYRHHGHDTAWWSSGPPDAPPLLLIHGFPTASLDWHLIVPALARDHRVIMADLIGFGFSDKPRAHRYSVFDYADQLQGLLQHLGITAVHVLAHDLGDTVAQELLARQQAAASGLARLCSVAFLNGGLFPTHHRPRPIQRLLAGPLRPVLVHLLRERSFSRSFSAEFGSATQPDAETLTR
jgi:pimeloyl-ACP methyl ester carboxylesterase